MDVIDWFYSDMPKITITETLQPGTYILTPDVPVPVGQKINLTLPWTAASIQTPMIAQDQIAYEFTVPVSAVSGQVFQLVVSEYKGIAYGRQVVLSGTPFDFDTQWGTAYGNTVTFTCTVGYNVFQGQKLYLNLRNWNPDASPPQQGVPDGTATPVLANWQPR